MNIILLLFLGLFIIISESGRLSFPVQLNHARSLKNQAHSLHIQQLMPEKHLRHSLKSTKPTETTKKQYLASNLFTDGSAFKIKLNISGLEYKISIDTGSADFVIKGQDTNGIPKQKYHCEEHSCVKQGNYGIGYLDGSMDCYATTAPVQFVGHKFDAQMLVVYQADKKFDQIQGICGISYPSLARHKPTFIQTLMKEKIVDKYAYGVNFNFFQKNRSFISFGQSDPDFYVGKLDKYPIMNPGLIYTDFKWVRIGNRKPMKISSALLDTGNTCISIDKRYEQDIISAFQNDDTVNRCYFYDEPMVPMFRLFICRVLDFEQLPDLQIVFDKIIYRVPKEYYLQYCLQHSKIQYCVTYIESVHMDDRIILGDGFFSRFYTYFNLEDQEIGIAPNRENITIDDILSQPPQDVYLEEDWAPLNY